MSRQLRSVIMLLITAIVWGFAFIAQRVGTDNLGPYTFTFSRSLIASGFLLLIFFVFKKTSPAYRNEVYDLKKTIKYAVLCGTFLTIGLNLQQIGIMGTSAGKAGFLTATYIVLIPILGFFVGKKVSKQVIFCVFLVIVGTYLLSVKEDLSINRSDMIILIAAVVFAIHIILLSTCPDDCEKILVNVIQFFMVFFISLILAFFKEKILIKGILAAYLPILYVGVLSSGVGFTLQIIALKDIDPTIGSLVTSLESVFAAIFGLIFLNQTMNFREISGCIIIFLATIFAQIPRGFIREKILKKRSVYK
ncbi:DMT family transporter [Peptoniphilus raoultii]|uniref:DMT family transporter n=1 Tax=Peptoniphilus raoultii TaxID=1776387 RepID=UPI0008D97E87|nr:DMT family transporter [Peptoniphilus raoultii]